MALFKKLLKQEKEDKSIEARVMNRIQKDNDREVKNQDYYNKLLEDNNKLLQQVIRRLED
jgi:hypothetical protein